MASIGNLYSTIINLPSDSLESLKGYGTAQDEVFHNKDKPTKKEIYKGVRDMFLASFSFAMMHLAMKLVIKDGYSVSIALAFRSISTVGICIWYAWYYKIPGGSFGPRSDLYWLNFRGILGSVATILFYISMTHLDLGDSVAMTFIAPVIMPILANSWLKESYSMFDAIATLFAMSGVIFISKPAILFGTDGGDESSSPEGIIIGLISAILAAIGNISIRKVSPNSHTIHIVNYMMLWTIPVCFGMIVYSYQTINFNFTPKALLCFSIVSICSFFGQFLMSRSLLTTPTRFVTPIIFSQVIFAYINQFLFWGVQPTQTSTIGVLLVGISLILLSFKIQ